VALARRDSAAAGAVGVVESQLEEECGWVVQPVGEGVIPVWEQVVCPQVLLRVGP
jgi:hypothetical protein